VAVDTRTVLDALGLDRFVTLGWSGGGPHALAYAALLPGRCLAAAAMAGVAPYEAEGLDALTVVATRLTRSGRQSASRAVSCWRCGMWLVIAGWIASALVFSTFFMKTMLPLRLIAIASNVAFMTYALLGLAYGDFGRLYPIFVLHACLLPLNVLRLIELRRVIAAARDAGGEQVVRALAPYLSLETHLAGETLFRRGEAADRLYLVQQGTVAIPEREVALAPGDVFGEVGLFAPHGRRTASAVCATDCRLLTLSGPKLLELCYQDAKLAVFLARLLAGYV
jgi:pimeloyl-ACP methyl ester carboxylesterase